MEHQSTLEHFWPSKEHQQFSTLEYCTLIATYGTSAHLHTLINCYCFFDALELHWYMGMRNGALGVILFPAFGLLLLAHSLSLCWHLQWFLTTFILQRASWNVDIWQVFTISQKPALRI